MIKKYALIFFFCYLLINSAGAQNHDPVIDTVYVQQRAETFMVDISYRVNDADGDPLMIYIKVSPDSGKTFTVPAKTFTGDLGYGIKPGTTTRHIVWDAGTDYPEQYGESFRAQLFASDLKLSLLVFIAADTFFMGDSAGFDDPRHQVALDEFEISTTTVTNEEYKLFCDVTGHPYPPEGGLLQPPKGYITSYPDYPVVAVNWYDAVRFCNWRSKVENYSPCYDTTNWSFDPAKNGYHLPTEAQWERAARSGLEKMIYPWGNDPPGNRCNYKDYDGLLKKIMSNFDGNGNGTLPVDSLKANALGLFHIAGNVWEWCNDWYQEEYYYSGPFKNPPGPKSGSEKVIRGGAWNTSEIFIHCAVREKKTPDKKRYDIGFRMVR